ncbi:COG4 transport protein-domain-containing protein [Flammula alnicola]|nr:COG4 transport protein-domain-containing protein [Flammula alnicola]
MARSEASTSEDPRALTSLPEILSCLSAFQSEEAELSNSLAQLLKARAPIVSSLNRLQSLTPQLDELQADANLLTKKVSNTAKTAERVGSKVRSLDEEMGRVRQAGERVGQVMELKSGWESAARHCARAMSLPLEVTSGHFAEVAVVHLQAARERLLSVFRHNFAEASSARDSSATSRFFKLFPAIGWEAEGLEAYAAFVVELVRVRSPATAKTSSPLYYITALTSLFESIAMIVDQHQPVVEKYYGPGKMKSVVHGWEEDRSMQRKLAEVINTPPIPLFSSHPKRQPSEDIVIDPREIDKVLSEVAAMVGRWHLFKKFLSEALKEDASKADGDDDGSFPDRPTAMPTTNEPDIMTSTASQTLFEQLVTTYYIPLETWYTRTIIDKAHRLSMPDMLQSPITTTTPDEYVDRDYAGVIKRKMDDVYKNSGPTPSNVRPDRVDRENRVTFIILLNDLDRLIRELSDSPLIAQHFVEEEQPIVKDQISSLSSLTSGIEQLFNQLLRPKLRNFIPDIYKDITYVLDEDGYSTADYQDLARKRFVKAWETLVDGYKDTFSEGNYRLFIGLALDVLLRPWEKFVMSLKYTELGAVRFDRDLRAIIGYLASQTTFGDVREKFLRLQQISTLLNLDSDEDVDEFYNGSGISWKIGPHEARAIAGLKL